MGANCRPGRNPLPQSRRHRSAEKSGQVGDAERLRLRQQACPPGCLSQHRLGRAPRGAELPDSRRPVALTELDAFVVHDERVMQERRWMVPAKHFPEENLAAGRAQQVLAPDDQGDPLPGVVHRHAELIGPVPGGVAEQQITALAGRSMLLLAEPDIVESDGFVTQHDPNSGGFARGYAARTAGPGITKLLSIGRLGPGPADDVGPGAPAAVNRGGTMQPVEGFPVHLGIVALAAFPVGVEAEPFELVPDGPLVLGTAAPPVVVLDPKQYGSPGGPGDPPGPYRIGYVSQVQVPGGTRGKAGSRSEGEARQVDGGHRLQISRSCDPPRSPGIPFPAIHPLETKEPDVRQLRIGRLFGTLAVLAATAPLAAQQKVALGKPLAETEESFTQISSVRELPSGKVLVSDSRDKIVHLVDLTTGTMTKVGREGQGPGEYSFPRALFGLPSGETLLHDMLGRRFLTILPDGKTGPIVDMPRPATGGPAGPAVAIGLNDVRGVDGRGRMYLQSSPFSASGTADSLAILRWERINSKMDTVAYVKAPSGTTASRSGGNFSMRIGGGKVWSPAEAWDVSGDGRIARVTPSPYRVIWYADGKPTGGPVQPYTPIRVTKAEKDAYLENRRRNPPMAIRMTAGGSGTRTEASAATGLPDPEFEETMPPFTGGPGSASVLGTPDGQVWVLRTRPATDKIPSYDVFDRTGALIKKVNLNPNSRVVGFGKGTVYVARSDEDDLQYLQRFAMP